MGGRIDSEGSAYVVTDPDSPLDVVVRSGNIIIEGPVTVSNEVEVKNEDNNPVPVSGPLTDTQLRASDGKVTLDSEAVVLGAGSAAIGKLAANSGVDIGDVDVTSLPAHPGTVASNTVKVGVELTRPTNTDAYIAKDVISNSTSTPTVLTFANFARANGGTGIIVRARLMTDKKDVTASFRLHLFHSEPTPINDNSPYLLLFINAVLLGPAF